MFKHNICGDHLQVPNDMLDSFDPLPLVFFANPKCPLVITAIEATTAKVHQSEAAEEPEKNAPTGDVEGTS